MPYKQHLPLKKNNNNKTKEFYQVKYNFTITTQIIN